MITIDLQNIVSLLSDCPAAWAIGGGWSIDLFVNRATRLHKDVDIAVFRRDQKLFYDYLNERGWQLNIAHQGQLTTWQAGDTIHLPRHVIWCKHPDFRPNFLELLFNEANETHFLFRRDSSIQVKLKRAIITSASGIPILAPEITLLYKSKNIGHEGNATDFQNTLPHLSAAQRDWLQQALQQQYGEHDWLTAMERNPA